MLPIEMKPPVPGSPRIEQRSLALLQQRQTAVHQWTDRMFAKLMMVQWLAAIAASVWISPQSWSGSWSQTHIHIWAAIFFGGTICSLPVLFTLLKPGAVVTRQVMAISQMLMSALLIHLSGGRIETHFHVFGSLAFLAFYRDWKVLLTATTVVAVDHFVRGVFWPESAFGVLNAGSWRWLEHGAWVVFELTFLLVSCRQNCREMRQDADRQAILECTNEIIESEVQRRTEEIEIGRQQLALSEQRVRHAIEAAPNGMLMIDSQGVIALVNSKTEDLFGYSREELLGHKIEMLIPARFRGDQPEQRDSFFNDPSVRPMGMGRELYGLRKDGSEVPIEIGLNPFTTAEGAFMLASFMDITARRHAEEANRILAAVVESSNDAIISKDLNGIVQSWNKAAQAIFGYSAAEMIGQSMTVLIPEEFKHEEAQIQQRLQAGESIAHYEAVRKRKDGQLIDLSVSVSPLRDADGKMTGASKIARDISDRKKVEQRIQDSLNQLERKNQELDEFTYVASHDLQEPIRKLVSFSKLLRQDLGSALNEHAEKDLGFIVDAAQRMKCLIQDLLALSRVGRSAMKHEPIELSKCVEKALEALDMRVHETKAIIGCDPLPSIMGDATLITQLYQNLIGNALKFVKPDCIPEVHITAQRQGDSWRLGVRDNGIGIQQEYLERIFAPFQRLHNRREYEGTGIGLSICKKSVERHGGEIWAESVLGHGTEFQFTLPVTEELKECHTVETISNGELSYS